ncbi:MAG: hypothetical protein Q4D91_08320 [Lautropia sp.]|nr:hypothetical protein [Lautropia sp.]
MNIVITGGAGFLGQRLARALLAVDPSVRLTLVDTVMPTLLVEPDDLKPCLHPSQAITRRRCV